jgi:hypothetical protein
MNLTKRTSVIRLAVMLALTMTAPIVFGQGNDWSDDNDRSIVGVWRTVVTARNCQTGDPLVTLKGLFTFNKGGTMSEWTIGPGQSPAVRGPGHGVWQRGRGWQNYSIGFTFYLYDPSGVLIGSQRVKAALHVEANGDVFTTKATNQTLDTNDNVIANGCGSSVGTRFEGDLKD